jgi:hypothetical protein
VSHSLPFDRIVAYLAGELAAADEQGLEDHYFACAACAAAVEEVEGLLGTLGTLVPPVVSRERVERLRGAGARLGATDIAAGADVDVVFGPDLDVLLLRLHADLRDAGRVDMEIVDGDTVLSRFEAVPADVEAGVVQVACQRGFADLGPCDVRFRLVAVRPEGRAVLGEYFVRHHFV